MRRESAKHIQRNWEEDILINDAFGEEFSLNNLFIFKDGNSSQVSENENQIAVPPTGTQDELISQHEPQDQKTNLSYFRYPTVSHFPNFLLPPEIPMEKSNDTSHIPTIRLEEEVERNLFEASRKGKLPMPHGEGSSKQANHSDTIYPFKTDIDKVFCDFWTVGETIKQVISTLP